MTTIEVTGIVPAMKKLFSFFEEFIERYPACWQGWMYWDLMDHED